MTKQRDHRTCTMCGATNAGCMEITRNNKRACCLQCHNGNTHPAPGENMDCAEWAITNGGPTEEKVG